MVVVVLLVSMHMHSMEKGKKKKKKKKIYARKKKKTAWEQGSSRAARTVTEREEWGSFSSSSFSPSFLSASPIPPVTKSPANPNVARNGPAS